MSGNATTAVTMVAALAKVPPAPLIDGKMPGRNIEG